MKYMAGNFQLLKCRKNLPYHVGSTGYGCIYVIEYAKNVVKIGSTKNPRNRFLCLEREKNYAGDGFKPAKYILSYPFIGYKTIEKLIHRKLKRFRKDKTELFEINIYDAAEIIDGMKILAGIDYKDFENGIGNISEHDATTVVKFLARR